MPEEEVTLYPTLEVITGGATPTPEGGIVVPTVEVTPYCPPYVEVSPIPEEDILPEGQGWEITDNTGNGMSEFLERYYSTKDEVTWLSTQQPSNQVENYLSFVSYQLTEVKTFVCMFMFFVMFCKISEWFKSHLKGE